MKNTTLKRLFIVLLLFGVVTAVTTQLLFFLFENWWLSLATSISLQIIATYFSNEIAYSRRVRKSLDAYDKLEYRKYPAAGIHCSACKQPNDFLLDWNTVGFKCKHCGVENGLEIQLNPYVKAVDSEVITM